MTQSEQSTPRHATIFIAVDKRNIPPPPNSLEGWKYYLKAVKSLSVLFIKEIDYLNYTSEMFDSPITRPLNLLTPTISSSDTSLKPNNNCLYYSTYYLIDKALAVIKPYVYALL